MSPTPERESISVSEILASKEFRCHQGSLPFVMGKDFFGKIVFEDLARMPHLLIGGASGTGKSTFLHCLLLSMLSRVHARALQLILIDTKQIELTCYDGVPHLLQPVVTSSIKAKHALECAVKEKIRRYELLSALGVRNIDDYNRKAKSTLEHAHLPRIVIVVDELSDLMKLDREAVEVAVAHVGPYGRSVGIHLVLATQRTTQDVITGLIKANLRTRVAFKVFTRTDSTQILDQWGAENLLGCGDMLFLPPGGGDVRRLHGAINKECDRLKPLLTVKE